jgi:transcriptional regulator with PAS, ATPase and Fis domain
MNDEPKTPGEPADARSSLQDFRWPTFFQHAREPVFLLGRHRRLRFVNRAWEQLTGLNAAQARGLACRRRKAAAGDSWEEVLAHALCPPPEVLEGAPSRARRLVPGGEGGPRWWDVEFFPLHDDQGLLGVLGKIIPLTVGPSASAPLPEELVALREQVAGRYRLEEFTAEVPALRRVAEQARLAGRSRVPVLIVGEDGTGKRWLARTIHTQDASARERTFVALDCERLPAPALDGLLFGDAGLTRRPHVGTLYFREPARLPRDLQLRLSAWVAEAAADGPRVVAGCRAHPADEVRSGRLLDELHAALGTLLIELPPLRDRLASLPWLVERMQERVAAANAVEGPPRALGLTPEAWEILRAWSWPGNLRELYAALAGAGARARGERVTAADLPAYLSLGRAAVPAAERPLPLAQLLQEAERRLILLALRRARGNKTRAAEILSLWRARLLRRMGALGIAEEEGMRDEG